MSSCDEMPPLSRCSKVEKCMQCSAERNLRRFLSYIVPCIQKANPAGVRSFADGRDGIRAALGHLDLQAARSLGAAHDCQHQLSHTRSMPQAWPAHHQHSLQQPHKVRRYKRLQQMSGLQIEKNKPGTGIQATEDHVDNDLTTGRHTCSLSTMLICSVSRRSGLNMRGMPLSTTSLQCASLADSLP